MLSPNKNNLLDQEPVPRNPVVECIVQRYKGDILNGKYHGKGNYHIELRSLVTILLLVLGI
jgi:hypothetical protein